MANLSCKFLVIGAGPGGYVAGIRAGQLGVDTIIVDAEKLGGTCLNVGCIPSKALIHAADAFEEATRFAGKNALGISVVAPSIDMGETIAWKDGIVRQLTNGVGGLLKKAKTRVVEGRAQFVDGKTVRVTHPDGSTSDIKADAICIATGSAPAQLPDLPFGGDVLSSTEALSLENVPSSLAVVGAGYIGLELGMAYAKLGAEVTILEMADRILPLYDAELTKPVSSRLKALGISVQLGTKATGHAEGVLTAETTSGDKSQISADKVLVTVGRKPVTEGWGRENLVLGMDGPFIKIDQQCRTEMTGIYAIGDVTDRVQLTPVALAEGMALVRTLYDGEPTSVSYENIPSAVFSTPPIGTVGLTEEDARRNHKVEIYQSRFRPMKHTLSGRDEHSVMKLIVDQETDKILGAHMMGVDAPEIIQGIGIAVKAGATKSDFDATIGIHPTAAEELVTMREPIQG